MIFRALGVKDWWLVIERLGIKLTEDTKGILAVRDGRIVAGCVFNYWTYSSVQVHFWIDDKFVIRHGFFNEVADYAFNTCGKSRLIGLVPADNEEALKLDRHIGFKETHRIKDGYKVGVDFVMMEADRTDLSRWLNEEAPHGQERYARSA